jgi:hypothetical protein
MAAQRVVIGERVFQEGGLQCRQIETLRKSPGFVGGQFDQGRTQN